MVRLGEAVPVEVLLWLTEAVSVEEDLPVGVLNGLVEGGAEGLSFGVMEGAGLDDTEGLGDAVELLATVGEREELPLGEPDTDGLDVSEKERVVWPDPVTVGQSLDFVEKVYVGVAVMVTPVGKVDWETVGVTMTVGETESVLDRVLSGESDGVVDVVSVFVGWVVVVNVCVLGGD